MGSLTVALAVLAGVVLAAVVAHGAWQARRAAARREAAAPAAGPLEPVFAAADDASAVAERVEPVGPLGREPLPAPRRAGVKLDALIDALATLAFDAPVSGDQVLAHLPSTRRAGSKPFAVEGLNAETGEWEDHRITTVSSKWEAMSGDEEHAPIQRNVGDYIDIAADGRRFACAWTDGREGSSRIYVRTGSVD